MFNRIFFSVLIVLLSNSLVVAQETPAAVLFVGEKDNGSDIYIWRPADENSGWLQKITNTAQKEGNARWWPHKQLILASQEISENHYGIVALNSELETVWLHEDPIGSLGWPVPSPWDDRILCVRQVGEGFVQPGFINYPEGNFSPFDWQQMPGGQLAWLEPDKIQLSRVTPEGFVINHRDLVSGEETTIVSGGNNWQSFIDLTNDNNFFARRTGQIGSIFTLFRKADGSWDYQNFTNARTYDWQPSVSPDGRTLIFRSLRNGFFQTVIKDIKTGAEKTLEIPGFSKIYFPMILDSDTTKLFK
jgi:hypothetical protein